MFYNCGFRSEFRMHFLDGQGANQSGSRIRILNLYLIIEANICSLRQDDLESRIVEMDCKVKE